MLIERVTIINKRGLHARAAAKLVTTATPFTARIQVRVASATCENHWVDAKSVMSLMLLAATQGTDIEVQVDGQDEACAMEAILTLITQRFEEDE